MNLHGDFKIFIPDNKPFEEAFKRVRYLGIGAHQDDLEFMAIHGILQGYQKRSFAGVTCNDGTSRVPNGVIYTDEEMREYARTRRNEQNEAAKIGRYSAMIQLDFSSSALKDPSSSLRDDLQVVLEATRPEIIYTHNPADRHDTHVAVFCAVIDAIRALPQPERPKTLYGCEVWGDLDWLPFDVNARVSLDVSKRPDMARKLNAVFVSQIQGGKQYDLAVEGRRLANATFSASHDADTAKMLTTAWDLTLLIHDPAPDIATYVGDLVSRFQTEVTSRVRQYVR
jgi:LmbE family N-acetylglucosaminyl deacetylase